ncbi:unnamed protein product, partial (macronuclear) [Paramecium tetraurelia]
YIYPNQNYVLLQYDCIMILIVMIVCQNVEIVFLQVQNNVKMGIIILMMDVINANTNVMKCAKNAKKGNVQNIIRDIIQMGNNAQRNVEMFKYQQIKIRNRCLNNNIKIGDELCDDQNYIERDGCTFCEIDPFYKCEEDLNLLSLCYRCQIIVKFCKRCKSGYSLNIIHAIHVQISVKSASILPTIARCAQQMVAQDVTLYLGFIWINIQNHVLRNVETILLLEMNNAMMEIEQIKMDAILDARSIKNLFAKRTSAMFHLRKKLVQIIQTQPLQDLMIDDICEKLKIRIELFKSHDFKCEIKRKDNQNQTQYATCEIKFNFFKTIVESNLIHIVVPLKDNLTRLLEEETREIVISPRRFTYYNQEQKAQAQNIVKASSTFTFLLQFIGPLTILLGGFVLFLVDFRCNDLDQQPFILQMQIFLRMFQLDQVFNIPNFFTLNSPQDPYYFEAPAKFTEKDVNPFQLFCEFILLAILGYIFSTCIMSAIQIRQKSNRIITNKMKIFSVIEINKSVETKQPQNQKSKQPPYLILFYIQNYYGLQRILELYYFKLLDQFFWIFVWLVLFNQNIQKIQTVVGVLFIYIVFQIYSFVCSLHQILYETQRFKNNYSSLYEDINTKQSLGRNYCYVNLIRKTFLYFLQFTFMKYLCCKLPLIFYQNPFENRRLLIFSLVNDFCIFMIICITVLLAIDDVSNIFSFDEKYFIGWIILFFVGLSIFVQAIFMVQQLFQGMQMRIKNLKNFLCYQPNQQN